MSTATRDFLVEIGTEELPPKSLLTLATAFADGITRGLAEAGLPHKAVERFATPRRLAVRVRRLAERQPDRAIERRGPPVKAAFDAQGTPTQAALAFAKSCGVELGALERLETPKGVWLVHRGTEAGSSTIALLPGIVQASLDALPIARRMRWGAGEAQFVRPVHWVLMLFGREVVPCSILDVPAGNLSYGHRFMAPKPLRIASPAAYAGALHKRGRVLADIHERRETIRQGVTAAAARLGGNAVMSEDLLDEVTALVEWPVPLAGRFDERFLELPAEVPIATMQDHQRYFPVRDAQGALMPWFVTVANIESRDPAQIVAGNERVVRPRLSDAAFFYTTDRQQRLDARLDGLRRVTFQTQLGSLYDKTERVRALAGSIAGAIGGDTRLADRAAELAKCDLITSMVGEFPELQGLMGRYYAQHDGEHGEVCEALREQYLPRFAGDELPATKTGMAVAIADKLDTIAGIYATGQKPTGTRDPFGLRRAALG
ncbi:MAG: glycine--tRNA ligase subunit beta, partial [Betaproteobacteria bacterium]|nr:glycine--tRNA ligase subunit beta [Betaproteobacteria bacterium]